MSASLVIPIEFKIEWPVEMATRVIGDGWMSQVHGHCPGCTQPVFFLRLRYGSYRFRELKLIHHVSGHLVGHGQALFVDAVQGKEQRGERHELILHPFREPAFPEALE